jgi:hypothetical protein
VNTTARLASEAKTGEILVTSDAAAAAGLDSNLPRRRLQLRGKKERSEVVTLTVSPALEERVAHGRGCASSYPRAGNPASGRRASRNVTLVGLGRRPAQTLGLRAAALLVEAAVTGLARRLRRAAPPPSPEPVGERRGEALERELAVSRLTSLVLRDGADDRADPLAKPPLLRLGERLRPLDVEHGLDPGLRFLRVLAARPA